MAEKKLKVAVGADTSGFDKGMKSASKDIKTFEKTTNNAMSGVAKSLGVPIDKMETISSSIRGLGGKMKQSSNSMVSSLGSVVGSLGGVAGAVGAIAVTALVAGFKALTAEANAYKNTIQGANVEIGTKAYIDTYKQFFHDVNEADGKAWANRLSNLKKAYNEFKVFNAEIFKGKLFTKKGREEYQENRAEAEKTAKQAEKYAKKLNTLEIERAKQLPILAQLDADIAEAKVRAYDQTLKTEEREKALAVIRDKMAEKYKLDKKYAEEKYILTKKINDLVSSTQEDIENQYKLQSQVIQLDAQYNDSKKSLLRVEKQITTEKEKQLLDEQLAIQKSQEMASSKAKLADWQAQATITKPIDMPKLLGTDNNEMHLAVKPEVDEKSAIDISSNLQSLAVSATEQMGSSIGQLMSDLSTGGDAWGNFSNNAIQSFGDMAVSVGKMAISTGIATLGIKAALESLNGWVAIAAGVALVALGTAVTSGLSNIANGNYNTTSNVASSVSAVGSTADMRTREEDIQISGTLTADGDQLVAVINNTAKRRLAI